MNQESLQNMKENLTANALEKGSGKGNAKRAAIITGGVIAGGILAREAYRRIKGRTPTGPTEPSAVLVLPEGNNEVTAQDQDVIVLGPGPTRENENGEEVKLRREHVIEHENVNLPVYDSQLTSVIFAQDQEHNETPEVVSKFLTEIGYHSVDTITPQEAIGIARSEIFMSSIEFSRQVKESFRNKPEFKGIDVDVNFDLGDDDRISVNSIRQRLNMLIYKGAAQGSDEELAKEIDRTIHMLEWAHVRANALAAMNRFCYDWGFDDLKTISENENLHESERMQLLRKDSKASARKFLDEPKDAFVLADNRLMYANSINELTAKIDDDRPEKSLEKVEDFEDVIMLWKYMGQYRMPGDIKLEKAQQNLLKATEIIANERLTKEKKSKIFMPQTLIPAGIAAGVILATVAVLASGDKDDKPTTALGNYETPTATRSIVQTATEVAAQNPTEAPAQSPTEAPSNTSTVEPTKTSTSVVEPTVQATSANVEVLPRRVQTTKDISLENLVATLDGLDGDTTNGGLAITVQPGENFNEAVARNLSKVGVPAAAAQRYATYIQGLNEETYQEGETVFVKNDQNDFQSEDLDLKKISYVLQHENVQIPNNIKADFDAKGIKAQKHHHTWSDELIQKSVNTREKIADFAEQNNLVRSSDQPEGDEDSENVLAVEKKSSETPQELQQAIAKKAKSVSGKRFSSVYKMPTYRVSDESDYLPAIAQMAYQNSLKNGRLDVLKGILEEDEDDDDLMVWLRKLLEKKETASV